MNKAVFPGSFDPFTIGHERMVQRGLQLFDEVIIGIGFNEHKRGFIPIEERLGSLRQFYADNPRVRVDAYDCLTVDFAISMQARFILRGVRSLKDYEYEKEMADINRHLGQLETVLLFAEADVASISSSMVRELHHFRRDISPYLPQGLVYPSLMSSGRNCPR